VRESIEIVKKKCKWFILNCFALKNFFERERVFFVNGDATCARVQRKLCLSGKTELRQLEFGHLNFSNVKFP
jgi:hypothetical protein